MNKYEYNIWMNLKFFRKIISDDMFLFLSFYV